MVWSAKKHRHKSLNRYQAAVRTYFSVTPYDDVAEELVTKTILETAETTSDPADLDELVEMMLRRVRRTQAAAKEQLEALHDQQRETEEALIGILARCCKRHKPKRPTVPSGVR